MCRFLVKFSDVSNLGPSLTKGDNGVCPEEMVELSRSAELPVVELSGVNCIIYCEN